MNKRSFETITSSPNYIGGRESKVYKLPRGMEAAFGEPCVVKIYTPHVVLDEKTGLRELRSPEVLEILADNEYEIGTDLRLAGLNVPRMHQRVSFPSPQKGDSHFNGGHRVHGVIMGELRDARSFRELHTREQPRALGSFVEQVASAMYEGIQPFDIYYNHNTVYNSEGEATLFDFCQWKRREPATEEEVIRFLREDLVLPKDVSDMMLVFEGDASLKC